jgi:hypothetical protein
LREVQRIMRSTPEAQRKGPANAPHLGQDGDTGAFGFARGTIRRVDVRFFAKQRNKHDQAKDL